MSPKIGTARSDPVAHASGSMSKDAIKKLCNLEDGLAQSVVKSLLGE